MNSNLQQLFDSLESQRAFVLNEIKSLSAEKLNKHEPGKWSISQIVAHIITAEQLSIKYLTKKFQAIETYERTGLWEELKSATLTIAQRLPLKFRAPRVVVENTPAFDTVEQMEKAWTNTRQELKELLNQFTDDQLNRKVYKHPVAGKLNILQAIKSLREHLTHHQPQIKKLLKEN